MAVTPAIVNLHVETDLADAELQRLIDDAESEIDLRFGSDASITDFHLLSPKRKRIYLERRANTLTSVEEGEEIDELETLVENTDHILTGNGWVVERLGADFQSRVKIVYAPITDSGRRDRVVIDLVRLAIQYSALSQSRDGDHAETQRTYQKEREGILVVLNRAKRFVA